MYLFHSYCAVCFSILIAILISPSSQLDTQDVYNVISGSDEGSCDDYDDVIRPALQEVIDMSQAAINDLNTALDDPSDPPTSVLKQKRLRVVRTLRTFWGIEFLDDTLIIQDAPKATRVRGM